METKYSTYEVRRRAILALANGMGVSEVADAYRTHRATVYRWRKRYLVEGDRGLVRRPGSGRPRLLGETHSASLKELALSSALDHGYESDLWTCRRLQNAVAATLDMKVSRWTVWRRLREAGLTYQKPERAYLQASEEERRRWLRYEVPRIRAAVRKYKAILYFQDESNLSLTAFLGKTWSLRGVTPTQKVTGQRGGVSAISAISGIGHLIFRLYDRRISSTEVVCFLRQMLTHHSRRHLVVVMDCATPHSSQKTKRFIAGQPRLHVFYLPKYSPDWNPDEKLWNHLKHQELKSHRATTKEELRSLARKKLRILANSPCKLRGVFFRCCVAVLLH